MPYTDRVHRGTQIIPAFPRLILHSVQPHPVLSTRWPLSLDPALPHLALGPGNPDISTLQSILITPVATQARADVP